MMKKLLAKNVAAALVLLGALAFLTPSCNTVGGVGEDVSAAGRNIQQAAH